MAWNPLGLLIEPLATNFILQSEDVRQTVWTKNGVSTGALVLAPDNTTTAVPVTVTASPYPATSQAFIISAGQSYAITGFFKHSTSGDNELDFELNDPAVGQATLYVNLGTGKIDVTNGNNWTVTSKRVENMTNGWFKVLLSAIPNFSSNATLCDFYVETTPNVAGSTINSTIGAWGIQLENSALPTSYIPTTTAVVSRQPDTVTLSVTNGNWDILVEDSLGGEWRTNVPVTTSLYTLKPRSGQLHVTRVRFYRAGVLTAAERASLAPDAPPTPPPVANAESYTTTKNTLLSISNTPQGLLANDTDPGGLSIQVNSYDPTSTGGGTVSVTGTGTFTYNPLHDFVGTDTFTYNDRNSAGSVSNRATVTINVTSQTSLSYMVGYIDKDTAGSNAATIEAWLGRPLDVLGTTYPWNFVNASGFPSRFQLVAAVPLTNLFAETAFPGDNDMAAAARGDYNQFYTAMAQSAKASAAHTRAIRPGWEMNGSWYPWSIGGVNFSFANYIAAFQNCARCWRAVDPTVLIEWCVNIQNSNEYGTGGGFPPNYFPGVWNGQIGPTDNGGCSVVSMDFYQSNTGGTFATARSGFTYGLDWMTSYAASQGIPYVALSEWGASTDDGTFASDAIAWMNGLGSKFAYQTYSQYTPAFQMVSNGSAPNMQTQWKSAWTNTRFAGAAPIATSGLTTSPVIDIINQSTYLDASKIAPFVAVLQKVLDIEFAPVWGYHPRLAFPSTGTGWPCYLIDAMPSSLNTTLGLGFHNYIQSDGTPRYISGAELGVPIPSTPNTPYSVVAVRATDDRIIAQGGQAGDFLYGLMHEIVEMVANPIGLGGGQRLSLFGGVYYDTEIADPTNFWAPVLAVNSTPYGPFTNPFTNTDRGRFTDFTFPHYWGSVNLTGSSTRLNWQDSANVLPGQVQMNANSSFLQYWDGTQWVRKDPNGGITINSSNYPPP